MKIKKISVKKLFGIFNHEIPLHTNEHITIIHGPNGFGKTVLLTMVTALFLGRYNELRRIPFSEMLIKFDNNTILKLYKKEKTNVNGSGKKSSNDLEIELFKNKRKIKTQTLKPIISDNIPYYSTVINIGLPWLNRISDNQWIVENTGEILEIPEILERWGDKLDIPPAKRQIEESWLVEIRKSINMALRHFMWVSVDQAVHVADKS